MNNKGKFDDIHGEIFSIRIKNNVPISQFNHLINNIKRHIDRCHKDEHDEYYYEILDIYHDLIDISNQKTKAGNVKKIVFNKLYDNVHNKFLLKESKIKLDVSQK